MTNKCEYCSMEKVENVEQDEEGNNISDYQCDNDDCVGSKSEEEIREGIVEDLTMSLEDVLSSMDIGELLMIREYLEKRYGVFKG